jgi:hypothetical protein
MEILFHLETESQCLNIAANNCVLSSREKKPLSFGGLVATLTFDLFRIVLAGFSDLRRFPIFVVAGSFSPG